MLVAETVGSIAAGVCLLMGNFGQHGDAACGSSVIQAAEEVQLCALPSGCGAHQYQVSCCMQDCWAAQCQVPAYRNQAPCGSLSNLQQQHTGGLCCPHYAGELAGQSSGQLFVCP